MRRIRRLTLTLTLFAAFDVLLHAQTPPLPALTGTVPGGVKNIFTQQVLLQMNHGSTNNDLVLVAAHRGYWVNAPENSSTALQAAFDAGVEVIEIDLRTTSDGILVLSHDADLIKETTGTGFVNQTPWSTISGLQLRDRKGNPQSLTMLRFEDALNILNSNSTGTGLGPVIIADIKDQDPWPAYLNGVGLVQSILAAATQPAVVFKMKMKNLPSISTIQAEEDAHPLCGHILPVINPEDATGNPNGFDGPDWDPSTGSGDWSPFSQNFQALRTLSFNSPNFVQQFELNSNSVGDGASQYVAPAGPLPSFATYYQPSFYPEGVSTIVNGNTQCCYLASLPTDERGILNFSLYYNLLISPGVSLITSDNLAETLNYLVSVNKRNVSEIQ
jgi:Glycerophosphoryl diester phosphodiesterase family